MRKVLVIGSGGAGKTTLALEVGEITGLPVVHLDKLHWGPDWTMPDARVWRRRLEEAMSGDGWILDGNYSGSLDMRLARADTVLFIDFPPYLCVWRAIRRYIQYRGATRPDMAPGCEERLTLSFLYWIWTFRSRRVAAIAQMIDEHASAADVVVFRSQGQVDSYMATLRADVAAKPGPAHER